MSYVNTIQTQSNTYTYDQLQAMMANGTIDSSTVQNVSVFNQSADPSACTDGKDDGKLGFFESIGSAISGAVKGLVNGVKGMFFDENGNFSLGNTLKTIGTAAACFIPGVGPVIAAGLCTMGVVKGVSGVAQGISAAASATTDAEAKAAFESIGSGALTTGLSAVGLKASVGAVAQNAGVANAASNSLRQNVSGIAKNVSNSFKSGTGITGKLGSAANTLTGNYYGTAWNSATGTTLQKAGTVLKQTAHDTGANMVKAATTVKNKGQEKLDKLTGKRGEKLTGDAAAKKLSSGKNKVTADQIENAIKNNKGELQVGDKTYKVSKTTTDGTTTYSYELKGNKSTQYMANENGADRVVTKETKSIDKVNRGTGKKDGVRYKVLDDGKSVEVTTSRNATKVDTFIHDAQVNPYTGMPQSGNVFRTGITIASGNAADTTEDITESIAYQSTPMATVNTQTGREYYLEDYSIMSEDEVNQAYSDIMAQSQEIQL